MAKKYVVGFKDGSAVEVVSRDDKPVTLYTYTKTEARKRLKAYTGLGSPKKGPYRVVLYQLVEVDGRSMVNP